MIYEESATVIDTTRISEGLHRISFESRLIPPAIRPGQFVNVICEEFSFGTRAFDTVEDWQAATHPCPPAAFLRRPFSIYRVHYDEFDPRLLAGSDADRSRARKIRSNATPTGFELLFATVGGGTRALSQFQPGHAVRILGPLGKPLDMHRELPETAVLLAGGVGLAPFYSLAEELRLRGIRAILFLGALNEEFLPIRISPHGRPLEFAGSEEGIFLTADEFEDMGVEVGITVAEGERGYRGFATKLLEEYVGNYGREQLDGTIVYACGPWLMLKESARICREANVRCRVMPEEIMACGVGACMSCICKTRTKKGSTKYSRICVDATVLDAEEVVWND